jgi:uncharacterized protein
MTAAATEAAAFHSRPFLALADGFCLDLLEPEFFGFPVDAIAVQLSRLNRFVGATRLPLSVAQHSVEVSDIVRARLRLGSLGSRELDRMALRWALLHDVAEIVTGDVPAPVKALLGREYRELEERIERAVRLRFDLPPVLPHRVAEEVRHADLRALARDKRDHMAKPARDWGDWLPPPPSAKSIPLGEHGAARLFFSACVEEGLR